MKSELESLLLTALTALRTAGVLPPDFFPPFTLERTRDKAHGDWACNVALVAAKVAGKPPRVLAQAVLDALPTHPSVLKVELAGPGFLNFFVDDQGDFLVLPTIVAAGTQFGRAAPRGQRLHIEFVSANPTSALHVGHGRGAAYGMTVANLLAAAGYDVHREYYVNDAGRQIAILATSTFLRYLEAHGETLTFPVNGYRGAYIHDLAAQVTAHEGVRWVRPASEVFACVSPDEQRNDLGDVVAGDKEAHIDDLIRISRQLLGDDGFRVFLDAALNGILDDIRDDLADFDVHYDTWFSERSLADDGAITRAVNRLTEQGHVYEQAGALWFRSTTFGDDKDRVLVRDNGQATYFASDVAYHLNKFERGFDRIVNIWGADHHGYIARVKAALTALGLDAARLDVLLVQFVTLWRGGEQVQMSSRSGQFIPLRELRQEVGNDAARFYYITRKSEQHIDFDLDLAVSQSKDNPVYYVQYAHARICSVFDKLTEAGLSFDVSTAAQHLASLNQPFERELAQRLGRYPDAVQRAAEAYEPHQLVNYLKELSADFHGWYNQTKVLVDESAVRDARLLLCAATRVVLANGLALLGVSAPQRL